MQEKQKNTKNLREREREREPFCCEGNYAQNERDNNKFIVRICE